MMENDKYVELCRYDERAENLLTSESYEGAGLGSQMVPIYLRQPYLDYEKAISSHVGFSDNVLELGAGTGMHTYQLLLTGAKIIVTDISSKSLDLLGQRLGGFSQNLEAVVADMESLPFQAGAFDVVVCAGSLSYGDPRLVNAEINRVLRPGGRLICVDTLNHNPIYRFNRWLHFLRGNRSRCTLERMPTLQSISNLTANFNSVEVSYYGSISYASPFLAKIFSDRVALKAVTIFDKIINVKRSAFKFVVVAQDLS